jgi:hypothetical protein
MVPTYYHAIRVTTFDAIFYSARDLWRCGIDSNKAQAVDICTLRRLDRIMLFEHVLPRATTKSESMYSGQSVRLSGRQQIQQDIAVALGSDLRNRLLLCLLAWPNSHQTRQLKFCFFGLANLGQSATSWADSLSSQDHSNLSEPHITPLQILNSRPFLAIYLFKAPSVFPAPFHSLFSRRRLFPYRMGYCRDW